MERHVDQELEELKQDLVRMAGLAEAAIGKAIHALLLRDVAMAEDVLRADEAINRFELAIDERCLRMLALYQPEASDLRFIAMSLKINNNLERIGDQAVNIAQRTIELLKEPSLKPLIDIPHLAQLVQAMLKHSVDAFVQRDTVLARSVCQRDDEVDALDDQIFRELLTYMMQDHRAITRAVQLILVSRHLERVADHATNIAEDVIYLVEGRQVKHHAQDSVSA
ncbi:MAG: phosphate transport system regulatory protein PhoU [Candidatus Omnitrophica bacterium CG11_big_fil_rev_8_21_14_0_20_63_9]|nr:MAG: phosphate transport system regulatory protein PhoU [Candidatus Omnitrophica bacterium CG11_big_fil_rev_8_21_14_0_20_63_9]